MEANDYYEPVDEDLELDAALEEPWDPELKLADIDKEFCEDEELFAGEELPVYNDIGAGPRNLGPNRRKLSALDVFGKVWPLVLMKAIVVQTNLYYVRSQPATGKLEPLLTVRELYVWMGLHIKIMLCWSTCQDDYFLPNRPGFDATVHMSRKRWYWIKQYLHFNDENKPRPPEGQPGYDPLYKVRPILDTLNASFRKHWKLCRWVSIDEMMIAFKGRNPFHRCVKRKPTPNGSKLHAICDAKQYYCVSIVVDAQKKIKTETVVHELFKNAVKPGMTVIADRGYTCQGLVRYCFARKIGFIGSCTSNAFMAKHVFSEWNQKTAKKIETGTFSWATNTDRSIACVVWKDNGIVRLTCTTGSTHSVLLKRNRGGRKYMVRAPHVAELYNAYYHGVDRNDQLRGRGYGLATTFRAKKYTIKMFMGLLDITLSNCWILWRTIHPSAYKKHREWLRRLAESMLLFDPLNEACVDSPLTAPGSGNDSHSSVKLSFVTSKSGKRRRQMGVCPVCKSPNKRGHRTSSGCRNCRVALCEGNCHHLWHTMSPEERRDKKKRFRRLSFGDDSSDREEKYLQ